MHQYNNKPKTGHNYSRLLGLPVWYRRPGQKGGHALHYLDIYNCFSQLEPLRKPPTQREKADSEVRER